MPHVTIVSRATTPQLRIFPGGPQAPARDATTGDGGGGGTGAGVASAGVASAVASAGVASVGVASAGADAASSGGGVVMSLMATSSMGPRRGGAIPRGWHRVLSTRTANAGIR